MHLVYIGPYLIEPNVILAPMAGVTDKPFRMLCRRLGAGLAVSEMTISDTRFWHTSKSQHRMDHAGEPSPVSVQIAGTEPRQLAQAARLNVDHGAQIIDINMGCPAKKVCNAWAGSALMRDQRLVGRILDAVVNAVNVPVTLKMRTGWDAAHRNALEIARIAQQSGIAAVAVHGRTRDQHYAGTAEYNTVAAIKAQATIPVIVNGDIHSPCKAAQVLGATGADAVMIGRAAQGRPWIFGQIAHTLATGQEQPAPSIAQVRTILLDHLEALHTFYGQPQGVRIARKHLGWYTKDYPGSGAFRAAVNQAQSAETQLHLTARYFEALEAEELRADPLSFGAVS